jgi:hypothetical protein
MEIAISESINVRTVYRDSAIHCRNPLMHMQPFLVDATRKSADPVTNKSPDILHRRDWCATSL